jgi:hypothetical protein
MHVFADKRSNKYMGCRSPNDLAIRAAVERRRFVRLALRAGSRTSALRLLVVSVPSLKAQR